jgi:hypothetical protein
LFQRYGDAQVQACFDALDHTTETFPARIAEQDSDGTYVWEDYAARRGRSATIYTQRMAVTNARRTADQSTSKARAQGQGADQSC